MTQVLLFLVILFGFTWTWGFLVAPSLTASAGVGGILVGLLPSVWAPTIIALVLTRLTDGTGATTREITARLSYRLGAGKWLLLAGVVPIIAIVVAVLSARIAGDGAPFTPASGYAVMIALQVMTGAVGEELGWRGFLLPRLGKRFGELTAGWTMGLLWSLWHLPAFFAPRMPHQLMPMFSTLTFIVFFGVFLASVFFRSGQSVLPTIMAHLSLNIMTGIGGVQLSSVMFWRTLAGIFGVLAALTSVTSRTRRSEDTPVLAHAAID